MEMELLTESRSIEPSVVLGLWKSCACGLLSAGVSGVDGSLDCVIARQEASY